MKFFYVLWGKATGKVPLKGHSWATQYYHVPFLGSYKKVTKLQGVHVCTLFSSLNGNSLKNGDEEWDSWYIRDVRKIKKLGEHLTQQLGIGSLKEYRKRQVYFILF